MNQYFFWNGINYVTPRSYKQLFELREIEGLSKLNGHFSTYWDTNYYNYNAQLDIGRF